MFLSRQIESQKMPHSKKLSSKLMRQLCETSHLDCQTVMMIMTAHLNLTPTFTAQMLKYENTAHTVVQLGGKESSEAPMEHGVPQGSILGPLFFIPFINELPLHVSSQVDLYADDTTLTASAHFNNLLELKLSQNISANEIRHWADSNKLPINESKSKVLTITGERLASNINDELVVTVEDSRLVNVKSATLVGLTIDSSLSFDCHVENLCNKLASRIGVVSKIRTFVT